MTGCGVAVLGILALIVYELITRSSLSWHAFGSKFFGASDWDPVNELFEPCRSSTAHWFPLYWH